MLQIVCDRASVAATTIVVAWDRGDPIVVLDPNSPPAERDRQLAALRLDEPVAPEVAAVVCTSGTTGEPRGVELTWGGLQAAATATSAALGVHAGDHWLCCLPLHHVAGLSIVARSWVTGTPLTVLDRFDVDAVAGAAKTSTLVSLVPIMARRLMAAGFDPARLFRQVLLGGAPIPADMNGVRGYGLTETWGGVVYDGRPIAGTELHIGPSDEVLVRGPTVMRGYRLDPVATVRAFSSGGWLRTGDAGALDEEGRLTITDRLTDLIITGGVNVSPTEVESVLATHLGVADVCVAGRPDPEWGEVVVAWVVPSGSSGDPDPMPPPTLAEIRAFATDHLAAPKLPRRLVLVDSIPRTTAGKPLRRLLP